MSDRTEQELIEHNEQQADQHSHDAESLYANCIQEDDVLDTYLDYDFNASVNIRMTRGEFHTLCESQGWKCDKLGEYSLGGGSFAWYMIDDQEVAHFCMHKD